ncbi:class I SAM-dependent methyltransferase [Ancylobacter polymorphus]|jgi:ubiquinone/menaquinone biosynthesis C-methylase UbiE|uniref:Ubiquinone/menaquinone biosynthesis C-methylase UbiE n=1 Tax=Ancylobacter polymorphus TaxID=223390 RepID=A0ABU0BGH5_9HYPH|nr:class I SAM-dependent methyltransferase [Ancylobacter polymorphus]MDQ0304936.1 ubiquinone/menaquinone biosynthesis C-methylase UbiE [Ancylobacter polymorphus]
MKTADDIRREQRELWNGSSGKGWVAAQDLLDMMFRPFEDVLTEAVDSSPAKAVLDVGCGAGATTLAMSRLVGSSGRCTGVDISEPLIAVARARAARESLPAEFVVADAETCAFDAAAYDAIVSRFGVMFFADPVAAFSNLRRAARTGAALRIVAWRGADENPFMTAAERAAAGLLPEMPMRSAGGPGQFAFGDRERVQHILRESDWVDIDLSPLDLVCTFPEVDLIRYFTTLGPLPRLIGDLDQASRARVMEAVRPAFDPYVLGSEVQFTAACWLVTARAPR